MQACVCGHPKIEHIDGDCHGQNLQCLCANYIELCLGCRHSTEVHSGPGGQCLRIVRRTMQPCGCLLYATPSS